MNDPKEKQSEPTMEEILASIRRIISEDDQPDQASSGRNRESGGSVLDDEPPLAAQPTTTTTPDDGASGDDFGDDPFDLGPDLAVDNTGNDAGTPPGDVFEPEPFNDGAGFDDGGFSDDGFGDDQDGDDGDILDLTEPVAKAEDPVPPDRDADVLSFDDHDPMMREDPMESREPFGDDDLDFEKAFDEATADESGGDFSDDDFEDDFGSEDTLVSGATAAATAAALSRLTQEPEPTPMKASNTDIPIGDGSKTLEQMTREMLKPMLREWLDQNLQSIVEDAVRREIERVGKASKRR